MWFPDPRLTLNEYIRSQPDLKGTKKSCGEGNLSLPSAYLPPFSLRFVSLWCPGLEVDVGPAP